MRALFLVALFFTSSAFGQTFSCTGTGSGTFAGTPVHYDCGATPPPVCTPLFVLQGGSCVCLPPNIVTVGLCVAPTPPTSCLASQTSYNGLSRQCQGAVYWPQKPSLNFNGTLVDSVNLLNAPWSNYKAATGQTFTINVNAGQYVSFVLKPTDAIHGLILSYNQTFGGNGHVWMSHTPGGVPTSNGPLGTCEGYSSTTLQIYPFAGYACTVTVGGTYYLNWSDGQPISYGVTGAGS